MKYVIRVVWPLIGVLAGLLGCGRNEPPPKPSIRWSGQDTGYRAEGDQSAVTEDPDGCKP